MVVTTYKLVALYEGQTLPDDVTLYYQMVVTASTVGFGDVTPTSRFQMIFFSIMIPLICSSFIVYSNSIIPLFD